MPHRPASPCPTLGCINLRPCPDHPPTPWAGSRERRQQLGATLTSRQEEQRRRRILRHHGAICHVCAQAFADQVDHVLPLAEGGTDTDDNLRPIHESPCHIAKTKAEAARGRQRARDRAAARPR